MPLKILTALLLMVIALPAMSADWNMVVNGKAYHMNAAKSWNEDNWGPWTRARVQHGQPLLGALRGGEQFPRQHQWPILYDWWRHQASFQCGREAV